MSPNVVGVVDEKYRDVPFTVGNSLGEFIDAFQDILPQIK